MTAPFSDQSTGMQRSAALSRILHFENTMHRRMGQVRPQRYWRLYQYYSGQNLPPDNVEQPLRINFVKTICDKHTSYLWGQWDDQIVKYRVRPPDDTTKEDPKSHLMQSYLTNLLNRNDGNSLLWDTSLNASVYGDGVLRLRWDDIERRVVWESILPEWFHCRREITNMDRLTEVIIAYPLDRLEHVSRDGLFRTFGDSHRHGWLVTRVAS